MRVAVTRDDRLRRRIYAALDPTARPRGLSRTNRFLCLAILASVSAAIIETEPTLSSGREAGFRAIEIAFGCLFAVEYLTRLWIAPEADSARSPAAARLHWAASPAALIDLAALLPVLLVSAGAPTLVLRLVRLLRIVRLAHIGPMSRALTLIARALAARRYELAATLAIGGALLVLASTLLYVVEGAVQPDTFGSIPRSLWWGVVTLTTIGYGDVYPVTPLGKALAGLTAIFGIGLIAAPTGILAGSFTEALRADREAETAEADLDNHPAPRPE